MPATPDDEINESTMLLGLLGSMAMSRAIRSVVVPPIGSFVNTGDAAIALVVRNNPLAGRAKPVDEPPIPAVPEAVETNTVLGSVGWTTILVTERPVNTSFPPASMFRGPLTTGLVVALVMR